MRPPTVSQTLVLVTAISWLPTLIIGTTAFLDWLQRQMAMHRLDNRDSLAVVDLTGTILVRLPAPDTWVGSQLRPSCQVLMSQKVPGTLEIDGIDGARRVPGYYPAHTNLSGLFVGAGRSVTAGMAVANDIATSSTVIGPAGARMACLLAFHTT